MNVSFDRNMVMQCYNYLNDEINTLESKKRQALTSGTAVGYQLARTIDGQIRKKQEELEQIKYALNNMT